MNNSGAEREKVFAKVCRLVPKKHVNPGLLGANWEELVAQRTEEILKSADTEQFEKGVRNLLAGLRTSHTGFHHTSTRSVPAAHAINATLKSYSVDGELTWVFQDVHEGGPAYGTGIRPGDLLLAIDDRRVVPPTTPLFRPGESRTVTVQHPSGVADRIKMGVANPKNRKHPVNVPRSVAHLTLPSRVGYLKIAMFPGTIGIDFAKEMDAAMAALSTVDRLIIDLRGNTGGGIGGLRVMSYLTPDKLPIGYSLTRARAQSGYKRDELRHFGRIPSTKAALPWLLREMGLASELVQ